MGKAQLVLLCSVLLAAVVEARSPVTKLGGGAGPTSTYIVHVAHAHAPRSTLRTARLSRAYDAFLRNNLPAHLATPAPTILYSYRHAMTGFAARLTARQAAHLETRPSVLAVFPDVVYEVQTTLSPSFLGLMPSSGSELMAAASNGGSNVVIAVLDTGVYPIDRPSFAADPSLPPPPSTFRGGCVSTPTFNASAYCNNKLVGAKFFSKGHEAMNGPIDDTNESMSPLDTNGHGTHCASTAAGSVVTNAHYHGYAAGTAQGMAPGARIASYKVCWANSGCPSADIIAGVDEAIYDNVDVISMSIAGRFPNLYSEPTATATFNAVRRGILVVAGAGNAGPAAASAGNLAPWLLTVGASSMNRHFSAPVVLGNGQTITGVSLYYGSDEYGSNKYLVHGGNCMQLSPSVVSGNIVLCDAGGSPAVVKQAGGVGVIISSSELFGQFAMPPTGPYLLPTVIVPFADAKKIEAYVRSTPYPFARIDYFSTVIVNGPRPSYPRVASFSSRGPNRAAPEILKPDVLAPGVGILAAWTGTDSVGPFNVVSGTSMATPHVSGIGALLMAARPGWSPTAMKSALMTTANDADSNGHIMQDMATGGSVGPFDFGAGHVDPNRALDPGLVFDAGTEEYISFLCALGYTPNQIALFTNDGTATDCAARPTTTAGDLNYPAFSVVLRTAGRPETVVQRRVLRNVGSNVNAVYTIGLAHPAGVRVTTVPERQLVFDAQHQTRELIVTFQSNGTGGYAKYMYGVLQLTDGVHKVVSRIAVTWPTTAPHSAMDAAM